MDKEKIVKLVSDSVFYEDHIVEKYSDDSITELLDSLSPDKLKRINVLLDINLKDTLRHKAILQDITSKLEGGYYD